MTRGRLNLVGAAISCKNRGATLTEPALGVDAAGSVTTTGAAFVTGGLSLLAGGLWERVTAEVDICGQVED